jgi:hypothetical protein
MKGSKIKETKILLKGFSRFLGILGTLWVMAQILGAWEARI